MRDWDQPDKWSAQAEQQSGREQMVYGWLKGHRMASWPERVAAGLVDYIVFMGLPTMLLGRLSMDVAFLLGIAGVSWNSGYMASKTSQSLGKRIFNQHLVQVRLDTSYKGGRFMTYVPMPVALARPFLHVLDSFFMFGFILPIFHNKRATFADILCRTWVFVGSDLPEISNTTQGKVEWNS